LSNQTPNWSLTGHGERRNIPMEFESTHQHRRRTLISAERGDQRLGVGCLYQQCVISMRSDGVDERMTANFYLTRQDTKSKPCRLVAHRYGLDAPVARRADRPAAHRRRHTRDPDCAAIDPELLRAVSPLESPLLRRDSSLSSTRQICAHTRWRCRYCNIPVRNSIQSCTTNTKSLCVSSSSESKRRATRSTSTSRWNSR